MNHLFIFTLGPVQSFIAQARKTQDLYAGSQLLSDLIRYAFEEAERNSKSFTLIFPFAQAASMPNRFVALLDPKEDIKTLGNNLRKAAKIEVLRLAEEAMGNTLFEKAKAQIEDFLETYWAAIPYDDTTTGTITDGEKNYYQQKMAELERLLGGVKNYRDYCQFPEAPARKCSVNGYYNALFYRKIDGEISLSGIKHLADNTSVVSDGQTISFSKLDSGEGICGVTMLRRCYKANDTFLSTAGIALLHIIEQMKDTREYKQLPILLGEKLEDFNHQFLYKENMENREYWHKQGKDLTNFKKINEELFKQFQEVAKPYNFLKYYAIIVFDADDMGTHFSNCRTIDEHRQLSRELSEYGTLAQEYVDNGRGKTIYAGGDDYVGMLNLTMLFETLEGLRKKFAEKFPDITFSAGISIAHYKTPLGEVLNYARKMEKKAKNYEQGEKEKDAFGTVVIKHSGEVLEAVLPWTLKKEPDTWNTSLLKDIHKKLEQGISAAFIKNLNDEVPIWDDDPEGFQPQAKHEIERYILRAKGSVSQEDALKLAESVQKLYGQIVSQENTKNFLQTLSIIDFLNRKVS